MAKAQSSHSLISKARMSKSVSNGSFLEAIGKAVNTTAGASLPAKGKPQGTKDKIHYSYLSKLADNITMA